MSKHVHTVMHLMTFDGDGKISSSGEGVVLSASGGGVEIVARSLSSDYGLTLSPSQAREMALHLRRAADEAERLGCLSTSRDRDE